MIHEHPQNTAWWGEPVARVDDAAFFALEPGARAAALRAYAWAEFIAPLASAPPVLRLAQSGFILVDAQMGFRLMLESVPDSPSLAGLVCESADKTRFEIAVEEPRDFEHERFLQIPGVNLKRLAQRYARWSNQLVREHPGWCLRILYQGRVQGWFLASMTGRGLYLSLAMLSRAAEVSGLHLYQMAVRAYAARGARIGFASFSVRNTAVLNIYSQLGARFTAAEGVWLWCPRKAPARSRKLI